MLTLQNIWENVQFPLICGLVAAALWAMSYLAERYLSVARQVSKTKRLTIISLCAAIAAILHILDFPLLFLAPEFYKVDFSELPVLLCGFYLGPSSIVACEAVKILLKLLIKGTSTAFVGDFANFLIGCSLALPAVFIYHFGKSKRSAIFGLTVGTVFMAAFGSFFNAVYLLPTFSRLFGLPMDVIIGMGSAIFPSVTSVTTLVLFCVAPLNLIKGAAVSILTVLLYKRIAHGLFDR